VETTVTITEAQVDEVFANAETQQDYCYGLYALVIPEWDDIKGVSGYPAINHATQIAILEKAKAWDLADIAAKKQADPGYPGYMAGGQWGMNVGWSNNDAMPDWVVDMTSVQLEY
jgi:hypothetical protein